MGIFDDLKKFGEDVSKKIDKTLEDKNVKDSFTKFEDSLKSGLKDIKAKVTNQPVEEEQPEVEEAILEEGETFKKEPLHHIPSKYSAFPRFAWQPDEIYDIVTDNYSRCSMIFEFVSLNQVENYKRIIQNNGYDKKSEIRFVKDNTYIIVDHKNEVLNIVYHIKKN